MPEAHEFLEGFGFTQGAVIGGYTLVQANATHKAVRRYQEYEYKLKLVFRPSGRGSYAALDAALHNIISQQHIIYGVRNPYRCVIDMPSHGDIIQEANGDIEVHLNGHSYRAN